MILIKYYLIKRLILIKIWLENDKYYRKIAEMVYIFLDKKSSTAVLLKMKTFQIRY